MPKAVEMINRKRVDTSCNLDASRIEEHVLINQALAVMCAPAKGLGCYESFQIEAVPDCCADYQQGKIQLPKCFYILPENSQSKQRLMSHNKGGNCHFLLTIFRKRKTIGFDRG